MPAPGDQPPPRNLEIIHATGVKGARQARGVVVVIDVLRSFTVSAYALAGGARECLLVRGVDEAQTLAEQTPGAVISAEVEALPVPGIAISNSPTQIRDSDLSGRVLIQRSSAGTQVMNAVRTDEAMFAASLVVARATAQACLLRATRMVTLIASADYVEDHACAEYIEALMRGQDRDVAKLLEPLRETDRYRRINANRWPGFPATDLEMSLVPDRFDFAMHVTRSRDFLRLVAFHP